MIERGVRGMIANVDAKLFLRFQFNPAEIKSSKGVQYGIDSPDGWPYPIVRYERGRERVLEFDLFSDATDGSAYLDRLQLPKPFGVNDVVAVLESFLYPKQPDMIPADFSRVRFIEPPNCYLIFGTMWAKTKLVEAPIRSSLFSKYTLTPQRMLASLKFVVIEEGTLFQLDSVKRAVAAAYAGAAGVAQTVVGVGR